mgnify:CR=1 FL=1
MDNRILVTAQKENSHSIIIPMQEKKGKGQVRHRDVETVSGIKRYYTLQMLNVSRKNWKRIRTLQVQEYIFV